MQNNFISGNGGNPRICTESSGCDYMGDEGKEFKGYFEVSAFTAEMLFDIDEPHTELKL